ncbi:MAG: Mannose-phosphate guanylyltransferase [Candidatus Saccharibacteria bacterium]|nr:Mannose-phosphate guanylyltransferase [Candidatus Saccharibacteria bacterium]
MSDQQPPVFDTTNFSTDSYVKRVDKPWGYELHWVTPDAPYMGKIIHINKGARLSLQLHDEKQESWLVVNGQAAVIWENETGELVQTELQPGQGYSTKLGQRHRLMGITDCDVVEVSTPELGTTWRLEDDYARPHETPAQRDKERA